MCVHGGQWTVLIQAVGIITCHVHMTILRTWTFSSITMRQWSHLLTLWNPRNWASIITSHAVCVQIPSCPDHALRPCAWCACTVQDPSRAHFLTLQCCALGTNSLPMPVLHTFTLLKACPLSWGVSTNLHSPGYFLTTGCQESHRGDVGYFLLYQEAWMSGWPIIADAGTFG